MKKNNPNICKQCGGSISDNPFHYENKSLDVFLCSDNCLKEWREENEKS